MPHIDNIRFGSCLTKIIEPIVFVNVKYGTDEGGIFLWVRVRDFLFQIHRHHTAVSLNPTGSAGIEICSGLQKKGKKSSLKEILLTSYFVSLKQKLEKWNR